MILSISSRDGLARFHVTAASSAILGGSWRGWQAGWGRTGGSGRPTSAASEVARPVMTYFLSGLEQ